MSPNRCPSRTPTTPLNRLNRTMNRLSLRNRSPMSPNRCPNRMKIRRRNRLSRKIPTPTILKNRMNYPNQKSWMSQMNLNPTSWMYRKSRLYWKHPMNWSTWMCFAAALRIRR